MHEEMYKVHFNKHKKQCFNKSILLSNHCTLIIQCKVYLLNDQRKGCEEYLCIKFVFITNPARFIGTNPYNHKNRYPMTIYRERTTL
jgi:hypothetical protein